MTFTAGLLGGGRKLEKWHSVRLNVVPFGPMSGNDARSSCQAWQGSSEFNCTVLVDHGSFAWRCHLKRKRAQVSLLLLLPRC